MAIDRTIPSNDSKPIEAMQENFAQTGRKIDGIPDYDDPSSGNETPAYVGLPVSIHSGKPMRPGGNLNLKGFEVYGGRPKIWEAADLPPSNVITGPYFAKFLGSIFWNGTGSNVSITIDDSPITGTAQGGGANTIQLAAGLSSTNDFYAWMWCTITGGTGSGQTGIIRSYTGSSKQASMYESWSTAPDNTSQYSLKPIVPWMMQIAPFGSGSIQVLPDGNLTTISGSPTRFIQNQCGTVLIKGTQMLLQGAGAA